MSYTYTPAYYSSFQDSITSLCKTILPFSLKKRRGLVSKQQTDYLKWQQDSFHQILNLIGLHREGILPESHVSEFKSQLLLTLISGEHPVIMRDRLLFLQELLDAKCISDEEYHSTKRALLQRVAGAEEIQGSFVNKVDGADQTENEEEEWSVIDLRDDPCLTKKEKRKRGWSAIKKIKGAATVLGFTGGGRISGKNETVEGHAPKPINKELTRIPLSNAEMDTISTELPKDKAHKQKKLSLKSLCDQDENVDTESTQRYTADDQMKKKCNMNAWVTFDGDDSGNSHPNLFSNPHHGRSNPVLQNKDENRINGAENKLRNQLFFNPFWNSTSP